jgi:hypothetical protein
MTTERDIHEPPELAADAAVDAPGPDPRPDHTTATAGASQPHDETTMRAWEGLPPDTMILAPAFAAPPMRCPDDVWAMLVTAVDIISDADPDRAGEVALFAGNWVPEQTSGRQPVRRRPRRTPDPPGRSHVPAAPPPMSRCCWHTGDLGSGSATGAGSTTAGRVSSHPPPP